MSKPPDTVTVLHAHSSRMLAKRFKLASNGIVVRSDYDNPSWFTAEVVPVGDIHDLHDLLLRLDGDPHACAIRAAPAEGTNLVRTRRRKSGRDAPFAEVPRRWAMLDCDGVPLPPGTSVLSDPEDAARALLDTIAAHAPELEGVSAVVQFSSSAGLGELGEAAAAAGLRDIWGGVAKPGARAHVWYWLAEPAGEAALKRWLDAVAEAGLKLDEATIRTVQPHYTAAPVFLDGLRDPLAGRRTVLVRGETDAATLAIPPAPVRGAAWPGAGEGGQARRGRGYAALLDAIGPEGFHGPILRAIASYVASNWPDPDLDALKRDIRARIAAADPGGRSAVEMADRASDRHLDDIIAWATGQEAQKRAAAKEEAKARPPVPPTHPDRGIPLEEAKARGEAVVRDFADRIADGEAPAILLGMTVGGGKSQIAVVDLPRILDAARAARREGAVFVAVPRHDLAEEMAERIRQEHPGLRVAIWRGMDRPDPRDPEEQMCRARDLPRLAAEAGQPSTAPCKACPLGPLCGYVAQGRQTADVWIVTHSMLFRDAPRALPDAAAVVADESFWGAGLAGTDAAHPIQMAVSALAEQRTGVVTGIARLRLLELRRLVAKAIAGMDEGGIRRGPLEELGLTPASLREWKNLEWESAGKVPLVPGMAVEDIAARLSLAAAASGFARLRPTLAEFLATLLEGGDARSVNATLAKGVRLGRDLGTGDAIHLAWRQDFAPWAATAPRLLLDATTPATLIREWVPELEAVEIEVSAPLEHVKQIRGREFGRTFFLQNPGNVGRLADLVVVELARARGTVAVILQAAVETLLEKEMKRRFGGSLPERLVLAHHGAVTGLNRFITAEHVISVGRPAVNRSTGERLTEIIRGRAVEVVADGDADRWPTVTGAIRLKDGSSHPVEQPRHPDPLVEAVRFAISEGAVLQAGGRGRGVRRAVRTIYITDLALPTSVTEVETWDDAIPNRIFVAAAEAVLAGRALPWAPADLAAVRPDLWPTVKAAERFHERMGKGEPGKTPQSLILDLFKAVGGFRPPVEAATYRKHGAGRWSMALVPRDHGRAALEAELGETLADFRPADAHPAAQDALCPEPPRPRPSRCPDASPEPAAPPQEDAMPHVPPPPAPAMAAPEPQAPPQAPLSPAARLAALARRLEAVRPPRMWNDATDHARLLGWQDRCRAAREAAEAAEGPWIHPGAVPRGGGPVAGPRPLAPSGG